MPDHPRSRGVYRAGITRGTAARGSSPLARGLQHGTGRGRVARRIIPARAGFTPLIWRPDASRQDHPRSRGVYPMRSSRTATGPGSSPLARGLLARTWRKRPVDGIIPARAGFTRCPACGTGTERDHPRSRGVYSEPSAASGPRCGSSPLARGLPVGRRVRRRTPRIIPARAGFTSSAPAAGPRGWDHPRSRGVYLTAATSTLEKLGSSPLARGLQADTPADADAVRIIPARAGFTPDRPGHPDGDQDHPRSRGVYPARSEPAVAPRGSSPLARGLQASS